MPQYEIDIEVNADDNASANLGRANKAVGGLGKSLGGVGALAGGVAAAGVGALGAAMVGVGVQAFNLAGEVETASAKMEGALGLAENEAAQYEETMRAIFKNNFGESFEEIADAITLTGQTLADLPFDITDQEMQSIVESAFTLQDAFGADMQSSVSAAELLMTNFALTSEEAFDLLAGGFQRGLDTSGDFLDTINEYGGLFSQGGASAEEFFSIIESGAQAGVLGTDKVADAFKEFQIRILDGNANVQQAFADLGLSYDEIEQGLNDYSLTTVDVMTMVLESMVTVEDQTERNRIGVELFGTQWEDSGASVMATIDATATTLGDLQGSIEETGEMYDTSAAQWEGASRLWQEALVDVGDELRMMGTELIPMVVEVFTNDVIPIIEQITQFLSDLRNTDDVGELVKQKAMDILPFNPNVEEFIMNPSMETAGGLLSTEGMFIDDPERNARTPLEYIAGRSGHAGPLDEAAQAGVNVVVNMVSGNAADAREGAQAGVEEALWQTGGPY